LGRDKAIRPETSRRAGVSSLLRLTTKCLGLCRPALQFLASVPGIEYHEWHPAVTPISSISHKGQLVGAKVLAASILDLMTSPELLKKARAEFEAETKRTPYFSLLPSDAKPDTETPVATPAAAAAVMLLDRCRSHMPRRRRLASAGTGLDSRKVSNSSRRGSRTKKDTHTSQTSRRILSISKGEPTAGSAGRARARWQALAFGDEAARIAWKTPRTSRI
jgi:hypothetical protein